jgi:hypothetical protein
MKVLKYHARIENETNRPILFLLDNSVQAGMVESFTMADSHNVASLAYARKKCRTISPNRIEDVSKVVSFLENHYSIVEREQVKLVPCERLHYKAINVE